MHSTEAPPPQEHHTQASFPHLLEHHISKRKKHFSCGAKTDSLFSHGLPYQLASPPFHHSDSTPPLCAQFRPCHTRVSPVAPTPTSPDLRPSPSRASGRPDAARRLAAAKAQIARDYYLESGDTALEAEAFRIEAGRSSEGCRTSGARERTRVVRGARRSGAVLRTKFASKSQVLRCGPGW